MPEHGPDVVSSERHKVKPWFAGKLKFSPPVKDLADHGFPLVGGSVDYVNDHDAAVLVYKRRQHVINVFLWPDPSAHETAIQSASRAGYHLLHWTAGGFTYWAVSDLNEAELRDFAQLLRE
jgi:anti-sigma factor RsiW